MVDTISIIDGRLVDSLGTSGRIESSFDVAVSDGHLLLTSIGTALRFGDRRLRLPRALSPRVSLVERFDAATNIQSVAVVLVAPLVGKVYEYAGTFTYEIRKAES